MCFIIADYKAKAGENPPQHVIGYKWLARTNTRLGSPHKDSVNWKEGKITRAKGRYFSSISTGKREAAAGIYVCLSKQAARKYLYGGYLHSSQKAVLYRVELNPKDFLYQNTDRGIATYRKVKLLKRVKV